jgi:hypothetical protein
MDAEPLAEVLGRERIPALKSKESSDLMVLRRGLLWLGFVELLRDVARLASLETVKDLEGALVSLELWLGVGAHSANASWGLRIEETALVFSSRFFSFFSISFATALRLRAPLADITGYRKVGGRVQSGTSKLE